MWKYVLPPVLLVAMFWIAMATATTSYMNWVESSYDRVMDENLSSIQFADAVQESLRRLEILLPSDNAELTTTEPWSRLLPFWKLINDELQSHRMELVKTAFSPRETEELETCSHLFQQLQETGDALFSPDMAASPSPAADAGSIRDSSTDGAAEERFLIQRIASLSSQINTSMSIIKNVNRKIADQSAKDRQHWGAWVGALRTFMLTLGPLVGLLLGWRLSKRLQKSVTRIAVVLQQGGQESIELGEFTVPSSDELSDMQVQAEVMVAKLKRTHLDLEMSRIEVTKSERLASVGRLAAGVAHELRNPLTSVKLLLQNAQRRKQTESLSEANLDLILEEVGRMESTIEGLLDFSRVRPLEAQPHDVRDTIQRALNLVAGQAQQKNVIIDYVRPARPFVVNGDKEQLHQVYVNLMLNAIESMEQGGRLTIQLSSLEPNRFRIEFRDTGPGIEMEILPRLFEPFATTKERGTGLGLAISRRIVDQHLGLLRAENLADQGALFSIDFPIASATITTATIATEI